MRRVSASRSASAKTWSRSTAPLRRAGPGRTGRRSATAAARRREQPNRAASAASSSAFHAANGAAVARSTVVERGEQAVLVELAGREREREVVAVPERRARPGCAAGRAPGRGRRPRRRSASTPPTPRCRSPPSSLVRRISRIALSSTRSPSISPRNVLNVDSTAVSSSTSRRRRSAGTWWGTNASWSTSSWRRTSGSSRSVGAARPGSPRTRRRRRGTARRASSASVAPPLGLGRRRGVRLPPRLGELDLERPQPALEVGDELLRQSRRRDYDGPGPYGRPRCIDRTRAAAGTRARSTGRRRCRMADVRFGVFAPQGWKMELADIDRPRRQVDRVPRHGDPRRGPRLRLDLALRPLPQRAARPRTRPCSSAGRRWPRSPRRRPRSGSGRW